MTATKRKWGIYIWMAGDNDLQEFTESDLAEIKTVGSDPHLYVVAQVDRMEDRITRRYLLQHGTSLDHDVIDTLGETNTGDPKQAWQFFSWAMETYPAERTMLIFWNHGSGVDETDIYHGIGRAPLPVSRRGVAVDPGRVLTRGATARGPSVVTRGLIPTRRVRLVGSSAFRRSLFSTTIDAALTSRGIAYDDTNGDFLDNIELRRVVAQTKKNTKRRPDIVGFDACLMSMIEIAGQMGGLTDYIIGSQQTEPGDGWPYDRVLKALAAKPSMTPAELGAIIVDRYIKSYSSDPVTLSMLDLSKSGAATKAVDDLAKELIKAVHQPEEHVAFLKAVKATQRYEQFADFLDLKDLCDNIVSRTKVAAVKAAAKSVIVAISGPAGLVVANKSKGATVARSNGVSIYFPRGDASVAYDKLQFAKSTHWDDLIAKVG